MPRRAAHFADSHGDVGSATKCAPRNKNPGKLCRVPAHLSLVPHTFSHLPRAFGLFQSTQDDAEDRPPSPPQPSDSSLYESTPDVVVPPLDMSTLASRMRAIQESESVQQRLEALPCAWVLVFDADTEEEAVYSMEMDSEQHVVLAFEDREEAEQYALSLRDSPEELGQPHLAGYESLASVQGLDVEALVVTSRDADFKVGVVFKGDLIPVDPPSSSSSLGGVETRDTAPDTVPPFITGFPSLDAGLAEVGASSAGPRVAVSITMVPDACFEGRTADDFLDPAEDPVWVLIHDEVRTSHSHWQRERERAASFPTPCLLLTLFRLLLFSFCGAGHRRRPVLLARSQRHQLGGLLQGRRECREDVLSPQAEGDVRGDGAAAPFGGAARADGGLGDGGAHLFLESLSRLLLRCCATPIC